LPASVAAAAKAKNFFDIFYKLKLDIIYFPS